MENKNNKKKYIAIACVSSAIILIIMIIAIVLICKDEKIDLNDYLEIKYIGYDGTGCVEFEINYSDISKDYAKKIDLDTDKDIFVFERDLRECINGEFNIAENLENGEEIYFEWIINASRLEEKYDIELKYEDVYEKVSGLEEIVQYDPFEKFIVEFSGMSNSGEAVFDYENEEYPWIEYYILENYDLSNGDKVTVEVRYNDDIEELCVKNGIELTRKECQYIVEGLGDYYSKIEDIPKTEFEKMQRQAEDVFKADVELNWDVKESMKGMTYLGCYLLNSKDNVWGTVENYLYLIYKIDVSNDNGEFSYYYYTRYKDLYFTSDGESVVDILSYTIPDGSVESFLGEIYISGECFIEGDYWYVGYRTLDEIYSACVTTNINKYTCESDVEDK